MELQNLDPRPVNGPDPKPPAQPPSEARSARNPTRHGLLAGHVVLEREDTDAFSELAEGLYQHLKPANPIAKFLVDDLAAAYWRRNRYRNIKADTPRSLDLLHRYETRFNRQIKLTFRLFERANRPEKLPVPNEPSNSLIPNGNPSTPNPTRGPQ